MPDETERAELIRQLSENDVYTLWRGPNVIRCKAAAQLTADAATIAELRAELAEARAAIRDLAGYCDIEQIAMDSPHELAISRAMKELSNGE